MRHAPQRPVELPAWSRTLLRCALPPDAMREAILGDLHEEFVRDVRQLGPERARIRYRNRAVGIALHAVWDSFRWRAWASSPSASESCHASDARQAPRAPGPSDRLRGAAVRARRAGGYAGLAVLAFGVLALGIVVNTSVFAAVEDAKPAVRDAPAASAPTHRAGLEAVGEGLKAAEAGPAPTKPRAASDGLDPAAIGSRVRGALMVLAFGVTSAALLLVCASVAAILLCWGAKRRCQEPASAPSV